MIDMKFMTRGINLFILYQESHLKSQIGQLQIPKRKKKMELQSQFLCRLFCVFVFIILSANAAAPVTAGGWNEIPDVINNTHVQDLGMFAVLAYNNSTASSLFFYAVFQAQAQIAEGLNVRMVIQALESELPKMYKAYVWEKPWENFKNLTFFEPVLV